MRKIIYHVATTIDNFICDEMDGIEAFLPDGDHVSEYLTELQSYDTVIMGRKTYEFGYRYGLKPGQAPYQHMQNYIISTELDISQHDSNVHIVKNAPEQFVMDLKQTAGSSIYLCGGGSLAGYLFERNLIDALVIKLNPSVLGKGKRLFGDVTKAAELKLLSGKVYDSGVVRLAYEITR